MTDRFWKAGLATAVLGLFCFAPTASQAQVRVDGNGWRYPYYSGSFGAVGALQGSVGSVGTYNPPALGSLSPYYSNYGWTTPGYSGYRAWPSAQLGNGYYSAPYGYPTTDYARWYYSYSPSAIRNIHNFARVRVEVPANAEVWFDGHKTTQTGTDRSFVSPPLDPKHNYRYEIRARWTEKGKVVDRTRTVKVKPGETATVDFFQAKQPKS